MKRRAAFAGQFYPEREKDLREVIHGYTRDITKEKALAVLSPHAGYIYSGMVAGEVFSRVEITGTVIILGPVHRSFSPGFAIFPEGLWETPLGEVKIDEELAKTVLQNCPLVHEGPDSHKMEHSLEVQVPFLQYFNPDVKIVPIRMEAKDYSSLEELGKALAKSITASGKDVLIVASSDMSHTDSSGPEKQNRISNLDREALQKFLDINARDFHDFITGKGITMCGYAPATAAIVAARTLGAGCGELVDYRTSYDVSQDYSYVVGYAGAILK